MADNEQDLLPEHEWPTVCTVPGCKEPTKQPHHHHFKGTNIRKDVCICFLTGPMGTRRKDL